MARRFDTSRETDIEAKHAELKRTHRLKSHYQPDPKVMLSLCKTNGLMTNDRDKVDCATCRSLMERR